MTASGGGRPAAHLVIEQTLGHITHTANLRALLADDPRLATTFVPIPFDRDGWAARLPGYGNWTVRAGWRARRALRALPRPDALFFHTQVPAVLNLDRVRRIPSVVSLDATPMQYDELGAHYEHATGPAPVERLKWRLNKAAFAAADAIVTWAAWTRDGLVRDYDVPPAKVHVIAPGVDMATWTSLRRRTDGDGTALRVLFVGGDLARKGGTDLVEAVRRLRAEGVAIELDLVTRDEVEPVDGIRVHHGLTPNSAPLVELYERADVFALPTLGDCLPMVLSEAGAVGVPLVSTSVGAIAEIVRDGETGLLVPPGDPAALAVALRRLADDPELRRRLGAGARQAVEADYDARANAGRLVGVLLDVIAERRDP